MKNIATFILLLTVLAPVSNALDSDINDNGGFLSTGSYKLDEGDLVNLYVFRHSDLDTRGRIDGNGTIRIPLLGRVQIEGKTISEAEDLIRKSFSEAEILANPDVRLNVVEYAPKYVSVVGEVKKPGIVEIPSRKNALSIIEVIALAGDFTGAAKKGGVIVTRSDENGQEKRMGVDVIDLMLGQGEGKIFWVYPDDVVYVPASLF